MKLHGIEAYYHRRDLEYPFFRTDFQKVCRFYGENVNVLNVSCDRELGVFAASATASATDIQAVSMKMKSGKLLGGQRRTIRKGFLIYTLTITAVTIIALAVFGTFATDRAQLQTVHLLGEALVNSILNDVEVLVKSAERECMSFATNSPPLLNSSM